MNNTQPTIMAVGDILIDAFITLQDARVTCDINDANCSISMRWGDKIPYSELTVIPAVGNGPNAAVSFARLGAISYSLTHIGNDAHGQECLDALKKNNVKTDYVITQDGKKTNYHFVLSYEAERTILIKHESFNYNLAQHVGDFVPDWIYFTSVAENSIPYHHDIASWVKKHNIKMAFQPGTFQIKLGSETLKDIYEATEIFFCNVEEAQRILNTDSRNVPELLQAMRKLGPNIICITDGPKGAYAYDGEKMLFIPMYPDPKPPVERTGAGDSFSSAFTAYTALGYSLEETLLRAPINSMSVVQHIGAQQGLLTNDQINDWLAKAPTDYKVSKIN
jgi:sugar/nucleoside kinase (ribokinase family)